MRPALSRGWPAPGRPCRPHAPTHVAHGPTTHVPDWWCDGGGSRGAGGRYLSHAEATFRAVDSLAVAVIEPAFRAALMLGGRPPPLEALRGRAADRPTVDLPPPAGPTDGEHRLAPRPAAPHRAPPLGSGAHAGPSQRLRRVRGRRGGTGETDRPAWEDGDARPGGLRSRVHGSRRPRGRASATPWGPACVGVKSAACAGGASGHGRRAARWSRRSRRPSTRSGRRRHHRPVSRAAFSAASAFASRCCASASAAPSAARHGGCRRRGHAGSPCPGVGPRAVSTRSPRPPSRRAYQRSVARSCAACSGSAPGAPWRWPSSSPASRRRPVVSVTPRRSAWRDPPPDSTPR